LKLTYPPLGIPRFVLIAREALPSDWTWLRRWAVKPGELILFYLPIFSELPRASGSMKEALLLITSF